MPCRSEGYPVTHFTLLKRLCNPVLRALQLGFTDRPYVIASVFENGVWTGRYVFTRVLYLREGPDV